MEGWTLKWPNSAEAGQAGGEAWGVRPSSGLGGGARGSGEGSCSRSSPSSTQGDRRSRSGVTRAHLPNGGTVAAATESGAREAPRTPPLAPPHLHSTTPPPLHHSASPLFVLVTRPHQQPRHAGIIPGCACELGPPDSPSRHHIFFLLRPRHAPLADVRWCEVCWEPYVPLRTIPCPPSLSSSLPWNLKPP